MKASELRIGNLVDLGNRIAKVTEINHLACVVVDLEETQDTIEDYERVKGIILTEEWLLKFGFERQENNWKTLDLHFATISWERLAGTALSFEKESIYLPHIKYVHQLQNLYFALTEEELEIKV